MCTGKICVALTLTTLLTIAAIDQSEGIWNIPAAQELLMRLCTHTAVATKSPNFVGLNITGKLDNEAMDFMPLSSRAESNNVDFGIDEPLERYTLLTTRWNKRHLTYKVMFHTAFLPYSEIDSEIRRAFDVWSEYTNLKFIPVKYEQPADIALGFFWYNSGERKLFSGLPGDKYDDFAHATLPLSLCAVVIFDASQRWTVEGDSGINIFKVALHEIGHTLGLNHSQIPSAVMSPFYHNETNLKLHPDDIDAIQALYGKNLCKDPTIDTIFNSADGETYIFKGDLYYQIFNNSVVDGYPKYITEGWPGLPSNIDAAFTKSDNKTYFFKGDKYWKYTGKTMDDNYPAKIATDFGLPDYLDTAIYLRDSNEIYFFMLWSYRVMDCNINSLSFHKDSRLPFLNAAFVHTNGSAYVFKGEEYYDFDGLFNYSSTLRGRSIAKDWFGC